MITDIFNELILNSIFLYHTYCDLYIFNKEDPRL